MKKLPDMTLRYEELSKMLIAPIRSKLLLTGIELKVFNYLSEPTSADAVAQAIGTHPGNTSLFLDGLVAIDLLQKKDGQYRNLPIAQAFLVEKSPTFLGRFFTFLKPDDQFLQNLPKLVKEGPPPPPEKPPFSDEDLAKGTVLMVDVERAGYAQKVVEIVLELPEFPSFSKMLDLGGGPGIIGMAIVDAHPTMRGVIFDLPPVIKETKKFIAEYGMEGRIEILGGDFNSNPIGEGYDCVLACSSLQFAQVIDSVVKKIYDALNPGGVFVSIYPFGQTHERTKPESTVLNLLSMALMGQGVGVDQGYVANSMLRTGFKSVRSQTLHTSYLPMELDIARK
jgi:ubiquinone/menaquinone biosynthesis C-methylase UbiE